MEEALATAQLVSTPILTALALSPTVTLIPSVLSVNKDSSSASAVSSLRTESSNSLKVSVSVWMATMLMPTTPASPASPAAEFVLSTPTVLPVFLWPLPMVTVHANVPLKLTSLSQLTESDIVLPADPTVSLALMQLPALPAKTLTLKQLITSASVVSEDLLMLLENVNPALMDVNLVMDLQPTVNLVPFLSSSKETLVKLAAVMATPLSDQSAKAAQLDA